MAIARASVKTPSLSAQRIRGRHDPKDMNFFYAAFIFSLLIAVTVFVYLSSRLMVVDLGYEISGLNKARAEETERNKRLKFELMSLKSPQRLEKIARDELGLDYPRANQIVRIKRETRSESARAADNPLIGGIPGENDEIGR